MENAITSTNNQDLLKIAKSQKAILIFIIINLVSLLVFRNLAIDLVIAVIQTVLIWQLMVALKMNLKGLWVIGLIIPLINLILLLIINSKATKALRAAGFRVGLLGADVKEIEKQGQTNVTQ